MRILICGSRFWTDPIPVNGVLSGLFAFETRVVIEGGAKGADRIAQTWAKTMSSHGVQLETYEADWPDYMAPKWEKAKAGHERNQRMLDEGKPDVVYAFKDNFDRDLKCGGTEDMVRRSIAAGVPTYVIGGQYWTPSAT